MTILAQICPKRNLKLEIHKTNVGITISILEISSVSIFSSNRQLRLLWHKFAQKGNLDLKFRKLMFEQESASLRYHVHQFSDKMDNFEFLGPNLPKNEFWGRNFKDLSLESESTPPKYHVCQFSVKMDHF